MYVYKYSVHIYLLCMIKVRVRWFVLVVCGECYNLGYIDRSVVVLSPLLSIFFFFEQPKIQGMSSLSL